MNDFSESAGGLGVYIHVPFCTRKCFYCDFNTYAGMEKLIDSYVDAADREIQFRFSAIPNKTLGIQSIFFGGGTPSLLSPDRIKRLIRSVAESVSGPAVFGPSTWEVTMEGNPEGLHPEYLARIREAGVNRLSIGVQSFSDTTLKDLGRIHDSNRAKDAVRQAESAGFENLSIDLMFGLPNQTVADWERDLKTALTLPVRHVSTYNLTIEEGTPFSKMHEGGRLPLPEEETQVRMYETAIEALTGAGFDWYEISNFAKPGFECRHNLIYWRNRDYLGIGPGAVSYINGVRSKNLDDPKTYIETLRTGKDAIQSEEWLDAAGTMGETVMLTLRLLKGLDLAEFETRFGKPIGAFYPTQIETLTQQGFLQQTGGRLRLTRNGVLFSNEVFQEFLTVTPKNK
jgi:oxygen-independent coproporphyrinogen-3 oxidase